MRFSALFENRLILSLPMSRISAKFGTSNIED